MSRLIWLVLSPIITIAVIVFAVVNRAPVTVDFFFVSQELPVWLITLGGLFVGFLWGAIVAFAGAGRTRQKVRDLARDLELTHREIGGLRQRLAKVQNAEPSSRIPLPPADAA